jgi:hypothetical protein
MLPRCHPVSSGLPMFTKKTALFLAVAALAVVLNALAVFTWDISYVVNDGVQYLSTAGNWLAGNGFYTDALIYDPHFQRVLPAPQTVWPPGYPFAIALTSLSGLDLPLAALVLNLATHALAAVLVHLVLRKMGVTAMFSALAALLFYLMAMPWSFVTGIITEPLFTTLLLAATLTLPNTNRHGILPWLVCGLLMAMAVYVRYSAVFFAAGVGTSYFICALLWDRPVSLRHLLHSISKLALMLALPILAFVHMMLRTRDLIGTLDRYSGTREAETLQSTLWLWATNSAELMGFGIGDLFDYSTGIFVFLVFVCLVLFVTTLFLILAVRRKPGFLMTDTANYSKAVALVTVCHGLGFVLYLSASSMSATPLEIVNRYLYQIYFGAYILFCFMTYYLLHACAGKPAVKLATCIPLCYLVPVYLLAQVNELSTSRMHFFEEGNSTREVMQLAVNDDETLQDYIDQCFTTDDNGSIWSTHGQQIHLYTGKTTITLADIYTSGQFNPDRLADRIATYHIKLFIFIADRQAVDGIYRKFMSDMKSWLIGKGKVALTMQENTIRGVNTVDVFIDPSACEAR